MYLTGIALMGLFMLITGIVGSVNTGNTALAIGVILVLIRIVFKTTLGPCCCRFTRSRRADNQTLLSQKHLLPEFAVKVWFWVELAMSQEVNCSELTAPKTAHNLRDHY